MARSGHPRSWPDAAKTRRAGAPSFPWCHRRGWTDPIETLRTTALDELRFRLAGGLYEPGDAEFDDACTLFNAIVDRRPRLVARCAAPEDVVAALAFARDHGLPVSVRAGGHSVTGLSLCDDGVVLDVRGMGDVEVDVERRIARAGGGATGAAVDRATQAHGLATTGWRVHRRLLSELHRRRGVRRVRAQYLPGARDRLARIKAEWDSENVFRGVGNLASP